MIFKSPSRSHKLDNVGISEKIKNAPKLKEPKKTVSFEIDKMSLKSDDILTGLKENENNYPKGINVKIDNTPECSKPQINVNMEKKLTYAQVVMNKEVLSQNEEKKDDL